MHINEALALADRCRSLVRRSAIFAKTREDILEEIEMIAKDLEFYAEQLDLAMEREYLNSLADYNEYVRG